jgi:hypothetical protein
VAVIVIPDIKMLLKSLLGSSTDILPISGFQPPYAQTAKHMQINGTGDGNNSQGANQECRQILLNLKF